MDMQACLSKTFLSLYAYIMETAQFHRWWVFWGLKGKSAPVFMRTYIYIYIYIYNGSPFTVSPLQFGQKTKVEDVRECWRW